MSELKIRDTARQDRPAIRALLTEAFGQDGEATLVERLVADGEVVLDLVAERDGAILGHVLFSRLYVEGGAGSTRAVALAPLAVAERARRAGIAAALVNEAHRRLSADGERLSVVLGDPAYYGRFGYSHQAAAGFASDYQCEALQALHWGEAPRQGRLVYAAAFAAL